MKRLLKARLCYCPLWIAACLTLFLPWGQLLVAQTKTVQANGLTLAYESRGPLRGEAIILVSGTGMQLTAWPEAFCEELVRRGYRVIRFDNRDTGQSTKFESSGVPNWTAIVDSLVKGKPAPVAYSTHQMAQDVIGLMDGLGIKKAHLVGISGGSIIAQILAARYPNRTLSLTAMMATTGNPALPPMHPRVQALLLAPPPDESDTAAIVAHKVTILKAIGSPKYPTKDSLLRAYVLRDVRRCYYPVGEARQGAAALVSGDRREELKRISVPTVVVHGDCDPFVPVEAGREVAATIPGATLRIIPGLGHDFPLQLVATFVDAVVAAATAGRKTQP